MEWQGQSEVPQEGPGESGFLLVLGMVLHMKVAAAVAAGGAALTSVSKSRTVLARGLL